MVGQRSQGGVEAVPEDFFVLVDDSMCIFDVSEDDPAFLLVQLVLPP